MKSRTFVVFLCAAAVAVGPALAGVVYEIETTDHAASPPRTETIEAVVEGEMLKMQVAAGHAGEKGDMIYRGDRREMVVVDHAEKSYTVIDSESMARVGGQVQDQMAQAMKEIEKQMEGMDPEQREAMKRLLERQMPPGAMPGAAPERPRSELKKTGETATKSGYPCVKYEVYRGASKIRELWVTDWSNVEGGREVVGVFEDMADFFQELMDALPDFGQEGAMGDPAFEHMREIGGFPVVTREFDEGGSLESESTLRSARRRSLDPEAFEPPAGYKRRSMLGG